MKINKKILSIPPYISTSWLNISSLHVENLGASLILVIDLKNGTKIEIPNLEPTIIEAIFNLHAQTAGLDEVEKRSPQHPIELALPEEQVLSFNFPLKGIADMEQFGSILQHNAEQKNSPDLPEEIINRIAQIAKSVGIDEETTIPEPEPHCNCMHCQIAKALQKGLEAETPEEEIVSDEDLKFKTWDISQTADKLYIVSNPINNQEHYNVYLGEPLGCTCGEKHCEHIKAVLNS